MALPAYRAAASTCACHDMPSIPGEHVIRKRLQGIGHQRLERQVQRIAAQRPATPVSYETSARIAAPYASAAPADLHRRKCAYSDGYCRALHPAAPSVAQRTLSAQLMQRDLNASVIDDDLEHQSRASRGTPSGVRT